MAHAIRNPFKSPVMRQAFDACIASAQSGGFTIIEKTTGQPMRHGGGSHRIAFWRGYESAPHNYGRDTLMWACYRAGQAWRTAGGEAPPPAPRTPFGYTI